MFVSRCGYHDRVTVMDGRCISPEALGTLALTAVMGDLNYMDQCWGLEG